MAKSRSARNVDRNTVASVNRFELVEQGLYNVFCSLNRGEADNGELMFMVNGVLPASAATSRLLFQLSGTCWNPLVFAMTVSYPVDENGLCINLDCHVWR